MTDKSYETICRQLYDLHANKIEGFIELEGFKGFCVSFAEACDRP